MESTQLLLFKIDIKWPILILLRINIGVGGDTLYICEWIFTVSIK